MPAPVYSAGTPGNLINGVSLAAGKTVAAFLDLSTAFEGQLVCELITGGTAPTNPTNFSASLVYGSTTLSAGASAGATSITVASATGLHVGQKVALQQAAGSKLGEVVAISAISGTTLTVSATINAYSTSDGVYLMSQNAVNSVQPSNASGSWAASGDYSAPLFLGTGQWVVSANNTDGAQAVTVSVSDSKITSYQ